MSTTCLSMIVKDEESVLERCLASVRPLIDCFAIVDTGSTDATREVVRRALAGVPGELVDRPWKNFGHNRTEALELARGQADYTLWVDADDVIVRDGDARFDDLAADAYSLHVQDGGVSYRRVHLLKNALPWRFEGVVHEFPDCPEAATPEHFAGVTYHRVGGGARSRDSLRFRRDAEILREALAADPGNARHAFYLAQSYRDAGEYEKAIDAYERRAAMGGWAEEVWAATYEVARIHERLKAPPPVVWSAYLRAFQVRPQRAEPMCALARYCRNRRDWALAFTFATTAAAIERPSDVLFLEEATYAWRALDEYAIAAYWVGKRDEAVDANERLLARPSLPPEERPRVEANLRFSRARARRPCASPTPTKEPR